MRKEDVPPLVDPTLYKNLFGNLLYITATKLAIMFATSFVSKFMHSPNIFYWKVTKRILIYIVGTIYYGFFYTHFENCSLLGYTNNTYANILDDRKNTLGYALDPRTNLNSWASKKQSILSISSA